MGNSIQIICPHCHQPSDSIKRSQIWLMVFVVFGYYLRRRTVTACATCMREQILSNAAMNLLTANILWPVIILPMSLYQYWRIREEGHDSSVLYDIRPVSSFAEKPKRF